ncbi:MAG: radical SAM protein [Anaerolineae bacterium]
MVHWNVLLQRKGEHCLLIDPETPNWILSSALGALILACCNGQTSVADLTRIVVEAQRISYEEARNTVAQLTRRVEETSFVADTREVRETDDERNYLLVDLNLTNECNLRCLYCYAGAGGPLESEMSTDEVIHLLDRLVVLSPTVIAFTGGEPLLRKDLFEIAPYATEIGLPTSLITNGILIDERNAEQLAEYFDKVQVSLDGSTASIRERLRGRNTFDETVSALRLLVEAEANAAVGAALTSLNLADLPNIARLILEMDVNSFHITRFIAWGRGAEHPDLLPDVDKCIWVADTLDEQFAGEIELDLFGFSRPARLYKELSCGIGKRYISIRANGDVYPCYGIHAPEFCAGNIRTHDIVDVYRESTVFKRCRELTVDAIETCKGCPWRYLCGHGCRALALLANGALNSQPTTYECDFQRKMIERSLWEPVRSRFKG